MEIRGKLLKKSDVERKTDTFSIQEFYLDCSTFDLYTGEKRENVLKFQTSNANIEKLKPINVGDNVKVSFYPQGRFYEKDREKRHFQTLNAFGFEVIGVQPTQPAVPEKIDEMPSYNSQEEDNGLPF